MATKTRIKAGPQKRPGGRLTAKEQVARLRSEVARLRAQVRALKAQAAPVRPTPDADGNYPAAETLRALLAQQLVRRRQAAGWTQAKLAARAGVRQETVSRLESGKNAPNVATVDKLDRALRGAGA
jgi:HTH-type transcriptional regulator / antitoxin HipB